MITKPQHSDYITGHFRRKEFACGCGCGLDNVDLRLVFMLQRIRTVRGAPLRITSGCRCAAHNKSVGGAKQSAHLPDESGVCHAADVVCDTCADRFAVVSAALKAGITRIGIYKSHVHLDNSTARKQSIIWLR